MVLRLRDRRMGKSQLGDGPARDAAPIGPAPVDRELFAAIYDRHFDGVYRYCYRALGDAHRAEDAAQQVFANALAAFARYHEDGRLRQWLFAIAHNVIDNDRRRVRPTDPIEHASEIRDGSDAPDEQAIAAEERQALLDAIARLPADQRRAIELRVHGLTGKEIAAEMGRSHEAAKKLLVRAVDRLSADLGGARAQGRDDDRGR
jgi:RNA polymerase sigma-70 factor (ECF subfamily)